MRDILLDRDGVILEEGGERVLSKEQMRFIPGATDAVARLSRAGHRVFVVTNQSVVGRGLISAEQLSGIHRAMQVEVAARGGVIDGFFACMHAPDAGCACRKPLPGLLLQARDHARVRLDDALFIGDRMSDAAAAWAVGARFMLVLSGHETAAPESPRGPMTVARDLQDAAVQILHGALAT